jgi:tRNA dimethylallyltransferase
VLPPFACVFGPTAVGKTGLLLELLEGHGEIVVADSMQVYRGLSIGTAKPDAEERARVPHHLLDIRNPNEQFHAGHFVEVASEAIVDIAERKRRPVVSGGTAFYFRSLLMGLPGTPPSDPVRLAALREQLAEQGQAALRERLTKVDPEYAGRISPADEYRTLRALEVYEVSGRPLSSFPAPKELRKELKVVLLGLDRPREELYRRIEARVETMMTEGLPAEVEGLLAAGYRPEDPALRGIGYREFCEAYLEEPSRGTSFSTYSAALLSDIAEKIKTNTRHYAKRQRTFFRSIPSVRWIDADDDEGIFEVLEGFFAPRRP